MDYVLLIIIVIFVYLTILSFLRSSLYKARLKSKSYSNCCPKCHSPLDRNKRSISDNLINSLTLNVFGLKRFYCKSCNWNGILANYSKKLKPR